MMKRKGFMKKGIAIAATVLTVFGSASTILAYEPFMSTDDNVVTVSDGSNFGIVSEGVGVDNCDFNISDTVVVYEDGTQIPATDGDASQYALCNHVMKSCYYHVHKPNSSGGCTVYVYNAQQCTKCGYLTLGSLYSTTTYPVCPH